MNQIDYHVPATLFMSGKSDLPGGGRMDSRDFSSVAEAIKYAVETLSPEQLDRETTHISAATQRIGPEQIRAAYARDDFPLERTQS